jgi:hypothetical protein
VAEHFTWETSTGALANLYNTLTRERDRMRSVTAT